MHKSEIYREEVLRLYSQGLSISKINKTLKISQPTISKILKSSGIDIKHINYQKQEIDIEELNRLYDSGMTTYELAKKYNCSDETIRKSIRNIRPSQIRNKRSKESIDKIRQASKKNWTNDQYKAKIKKSTDSEDYKAKLSAAAITNYHKSLGAWIKEAESRAIISRRSKALWNNKDYRDNQLARLSYHMADLTSASVEALKDPIKRQAWIDKLRKIGAKNITNKGWVSSAQKQLYYILSISGIEYHEEGPDTQISPIYVVDCVVPQQQEMKRPLIIEVQGEYWHSLPHVAIKDRQKATYIRQHTNYDLIQLEDLHLASYAEVSSKLKELGLAVAICKCKPKEVIIKQITEAEASLFYSIFHYTGTVRKGALVYGAFYNNELVAAISYCYPIRLETSKRLGFNHRQVMEISRMARKTNLICKNLMSHLIAKTKYLLPSDIKCIVSYSDSTYKHTGTVYKAAGFSLDGVVAPDYFYISLNGRYHKKTIWDRAKKMKLSEAEYAVQHNLLKVYGKSKSRWIYKI